MNFNCKIDIFPKLNLKIDNYFQYIKHLFLRLRHFRNVLCFIFETFWECVIVCVLGIIVDPQHRFELHDSIYMHMIFQ